MGRFDSATRNIEDSYRIDSSEDGEVGCTRENILDVRGNVEFTVTIYWSEEES